MKRQTAFVFSIPIIFTLLSGIALGADEPRYAFKPAENPTYEITVRTELPTTIKTTIGYLILRPQSVDSSGQITLNYAWGVRVFRTQEGDHTNNVSFGSLAPMFQEPAAAGEGRQVVIDALGAIVRADGPPNDAQLDSMQGSAWNLPLQPLPPQGQTTWTTKRQIKLFHEEKTGGAGGPFGGGGKTTRVESPADENITYTVKPQQNGDVLTVEREYELATLEKVGDVPIQHTKGSGQYVFDIKSGRITSLQWDLVNMYAAKNVLVKIPVTVTARLLPDDERAKLKSEIDAAEEKRQNAEKENQLTVRDVQKLPDGMKATEILGTTKGGGPFCIASAERKSVIGFRIQTADFMRRKCFRTFEPLYEKPQGDPEKDVTILLAKEGYAVGAVTVNADEFLNALSVTFMKKTDTGLDPKTSYVSPWFNTKVGASQKVLGGDGRWIVGICGRKGLNVDSLGLVILEAAPANEGDK